MYNPTIGVSDNMRLGPATVETKRQSQISEQLDIQCGLISELAKALDSLDERLAEVVRKVPTPIQAETKEADELVALARLLKANNDYISRNINRISTIINTLEL